MNRVNLLGRLRNYIQGQNLPGPVGEVYLRSVNPLVKSRSIFISGYQTQQDFQDQFVNNFNQYLMDQNEIFFDSSERFYLTLDELQQSDLISRQETLLENNWRGRLITANRVAGIWNNPVDAFELFLKSTWRIIVQQDSQNIFYVHHDIFPVLWSMGFSTAGFSTFDKQVYSAIKFLTRDISPMDFENDIVRCFVKRHNENHFTPMGDGKDPSDVWHDPEAVTEEFVNALNAWFNQSV